jgi:tetratricopeptide (TPR) repeat protein
LIGAAAVLFVAGLTKEINLAFALLAPFALRGKAAWKKPLPVYLAALAAGALVILKDPGLHKAGAMTLLTWIERVLGSAHNYGELLLGFKQAPLFTFSLVDQNSTIGGLLIAAFLTLAIWTSRLDWQYRFAWTGFLLAYLPASNILPVPSLLVGPYRMAVPAMFLALVLGGLAGARTSSSASPRTVPGPGLASLLVLFWIAMCATTTTDAIKGWQTELGFFAQVRQYDPHSIVTRLSQIAALLKASRAQEAKENSEEILAWIYQDQNALKRVADNEGGNGAPEKTIAILYFLDSSSKDALGQNGFDSLVKGYALDPKNADILAAMGDHFLASDRQRAIAFYEASVREDPKDWENLRRLAKQRFLDHRFSEAEDLYRQAVAQAPLASVAWYELSILFEQQGRFADAIKAMKEGEKGFIFDREGFRQRILELQAKENAQN